MIEEWREVPGYEGLYEVSDWGRIRRNGKILKTRNNGHGYLHVDLCKNGLVKTINIHRLVALAFLQNPNNYPQINHIDEDKTNNAVENLEWCDAKYNSNYGTRNKRVSEKMSRPVLQFDLLGNFIREWPSGLKAEEELGINHQSISSCCLGKKYKSAGGFVWRFKE